MKAWWLKYTQLHGPGFYSPGSWPRAIFRNNTDESLISLTNHDDRLRELIRYNMHGVLTAAHEAGGCVPVVADGDPAMFQDWIRIAYGRVLRERMGAKPHSGKKYRQYLLRRPKYARKGLYERLHGELGFARRAKIAHEVLLEMRKEFNQPELKLLVGIPAPDSSGILTGMYFGGEPFLRLIADEWNVMLEALPAEDVVYAVEEPIEQVLVAVLSLVGLGGWLARYYGRRLAKLVSLLPRAQQEEITIATHQCWGALHGSTAIEAVFRAAFKPLTKIPLVGRLATGLANGLSRRIQNSRVIRRLTTALHDAAITEIHPNSRARLVLMQLPLAEGTLPPPRQRRCYHGLSGLREELRQIVLVGGLTHYAHEDEYADEARLAAEAEMGGQFDAYGPYCGLGRETEAHARAEVAQAIELGLRRG